ncbi:MAG: hypothetical protein NC827_00545 [Candidatus Omnitrophica bacterium]|nr:hypothetical protein [Candidatus Omnitrophota bacterium]MCM8801791.1 hypothetical protein [Candidatus Omnitrophota bacterium]
MGKIIFLTVFLFIKNLVSVNEINNFSQKLIFEIAGGEYEQIFKSFYIPENYGEKNLRNDREAILKGLEFIINQLGEIKYFKKIDKIEEKSRDISLKLGPFEEIENLKSLFTTYRIDFKNFGNAYIFFEIIEKENKIFLKKIGFMLPEQNKKTPQILQSVLNFFSNLASQQSKREK